jgi:hypothetical protein
MSQSASPAKPAGSVRSAAKPLDFGGTGINGSLDAQGRLIAVNFYHSRFGYVSLSSAAPFPDEARYNQSTVRAYRASLATLDGFGIQFQESIASIESALLVDVVPHHHIVTEAGSEVFIRTFVDRDCAHQSLHLPQAAALSFSGTLSLQRCAYSQLTEGGPIPAPPVETHVRLDGEILVIENPHIGCVCISGLPLAGEPKIQLSPDGSVTLNFTLASTTDIHLILAFGESLDEAQTRLSAARPEINGGLTAFNWRKRWGNTTADPILRRGLLYSLNMAVPVNEGYCLLTDHMLLPLSWNRDAYYMARALLTWNNSDVGCQAVVKGHLVWMFETAQLIDGAWGRCYLANGVIKDPAFQLDQQLFPLLELAEYVTKTDDSETFDRFRPQVKNVLAMLKHRRASYAALYPTDETPADDPIAYPYHLSSHILFWVVLRKLGRLGLDTSDEMQAISEAVWQHFVAEYQGRQLFAYASDGAGSTHLYHDANDFPTILAPIWGFCAADDSVWRATIDYAFSDANSEGYYNGHLGSVHTRAAWPLGDVQEIIAARLLNDPQREEKALNALYKAAQQDGALPEAYDVATNAVASRHWFSWPNAAYACTMLNAFSG